MKTVPMPPELMLTHAGFEPLKLKVDLAVGKTVDVTQTLKELPKLGAVTITVKGSATWAEVFYKGKDLGRTRTLKGVTTFHLPVGKQQIRLENGAKKSKTLTFNVTGGPQPIDVSFDQ